MFKKICLFFFFFQAEDGIRDGHVTGVQTCALPISRRQRVRPPRRRSGARRRRRAPRQGFDAALRPVARERSEERRVGKECRSRWSACHEKKKEKRLKTKSERGRRRRSDE